MSVSTTPSQSWVVYAHIRHISRKENNNLQNINGKMALKKCRCQQRPHRVKSTDIYDLMKIGPLKRITDISAGKKNNNLQKEQLSCSRQPQLKAPKLIGPSTCKPKQNTWWYSPYTLLILSSFNPELTSLIDIATTILICTVSFQSISFTTLLPMYVNYSTVLA